MPAVQIGNSIDAHNEVRGQLKIGDSKTKALSILEPTQIDLDEQYRKQPDLFLDDGTLVEIYYFRSQWISDGVTTDDEFTPYIFKDDTLVGIGWAALGGPKSKGIPRSYTPSASGNGHYDNVQAQNAKWAEDQKRRVCQDTIRQQKLGMKSARDVERACQ